MKFKSEIPIIGQRPPGINQQKVQVPIGEFLKLLKQMNETLSELLVAVKEAKDNSVFFNGDLHRRDRESIDTPTEEGYSKL